jgi:hypothetical protein
MHPKLSHTLILLNIPDSLKPILLLNLKSNIILLTPNLITDHNPVLNTHNSPILSDTSLHPNLYNQSLPNSNHNPNSNPNPNPNHNPNHNPNPNLNLNPNPILNHPHQKRRHPSNPFKNPLTVLDLLPTNPSHANSPRKGSQVRASESVINTNAY